MSDKSIHERLDEVDAITEIIKAIIKAILATLESQGVSVTLDQSSAGFLE